ncbi:MAG: hypothetical protein H6709_17475 [Kofleriaceae bacterium]|nr:hypothetical protein [Kofleriaceae bacterium]
MSSRSIMLAVMVMLALGGCRKASESGPRGAEGGPAGPTTGARDAGAAPADAAATPTPLTGDWSVELAIEEQGAALVTRDTVLVDSSGLVELVPGMTSQGDHGPIDLTVDPSELDELRRLLGAPEVARLRTNPPSGEGVHTFLTIRSDAGVHDVDLFGAVPAGARAVIAELTRLGARARADGTPVPVPGMFTVSAWTVSPGATAPRPVVLTVHSDGVVEMGWIGEPPAQSAQLTPAQVDDVGRFATSGALRALDSEPEDDLHDFTHVRIDDGSAPRELVRGAPLPRAVALLRRAIYDVAYAGRLPDHP